ncbi:MAG: ATP-dependent helicase [Ilumatobacteraceae bacterium]
MLPVAGISDREVGRDDDGRALAGLDTEQVAAVTTPSTLVAVIAGAGSGKTRVLTSRIAHRVADGSADAAHTLALTFTREAAGELRRRLRRTGVRDHVEAVTFHSVCLNLLRQRARDLDRPVPSIVEDRDRLLAMVAGGAPVAPLAAEVAWAGARGIEPDRYVEAAQAAGRRGRLPPQRIGEVLADYQTLKRRRGVVDLDDLISLTARELVRDATFADAVRWRFRHVLVDEAQDLNPIQFRLLELLVGDRRDLYLVGDPAQAIYGFNGSDPLLLGDIAERMSGVEILHLPTNHRSTPQIVAAGAHVLDGGDVATVGARASRSDGAGVRVLAADDERHEAALVTAFLRSLDPGDVRNGRVAVLARTHQQLRRLEEALRESGFPVRRWQPIDQTPTGRVVREVVRLPSASRLREWAEDAMDRVAEQEASPNSPRAVAPELAVATAVVQFLREQPQGDGVALRWWLTTSTAFEPDEHGIELLTFHGAKGREWPCVVVVGVETGLVPHRSATTIAARAEEARLLHVALTRAADRLVITWAGRRNGYARRPSPLIEGLDTATAPVVPIPPELRSAGARGPRSIDVLNEWRERAARAAGVLPVELCSNADLEAIAAARPDTPQALADVTSFGVLTATRLFPAVHEVLAAGDRT